MKERFSFTLSLEGNVFLTTVRLAVGGIASAAGLDVDSSEDLKVCVSESLLIFRRDGYTEATACFVVSDDGVRAVISAQGRTAQEEGEDPDNEISYAILGALVDEIAFAGREKGSETPSVSLFKKK